MNNRDREYVENRLTAPASELLEALEEAEEESAAETLMIALTNLTDICRTVRYQLWYPERLSP